MISPPVITEHYTTDSTVTVNSTAYVKAGTSAVYNDASEIRKAVNEAIQNGSTNVNFKVNIPYNVSVDSVQVDFSASVISDLVNRTNASITVTTPLAIITIPNDSLSQIDRSTSSFTISAALNGSRALRVALSQDGQTIGALSSGMKVEVPGSYIPHTSGIVAILVNLDGTESVLPKSFLNSNGNLAILLDIGSAAIRFQDNSKYFSDVSNDYWASNAIDFVSSHGLFQGTTNITFDSSITMNRAMFVTVLHRLESTPYTGIYSFPDVPADVYYAQAAAWASSEGIVRGNGTEFSGDHVVTRQEMVVMLYRYMQAITGSKGQVGSYYGMGGANQVAAWADEAMCWAVGSGIIQGANGDLNPMNSATRAEVAQMMSNFVKLITQ